MDGHDATSAVILSLQCVSLSTNKHQPLELLQNLSCIAQKSSSLLLERICFLCCKECHLYLHVAFSDHFAEQSRLFGGQIIVKRLNGLEHPDPNRLRIAGLTLGVSTAALADLTTGIYS